MALQTVELFQDITVGNTEDQIAVNDFRRELYIIVDPNNTGTIQFCVSATAAIANSKAVAAGTNIPLTLQPGQKLRALGSAAGQKFMITG
jgi:hypothetical protein